MATKITTALVAALVVGALMTPNQEALARGGGGLAAEVMEVVSTAEASTEVVSTKERFLMACNDAVAPEVIVYAAPHQLAITAGGQQRTLTMNSPFSVVS